MKRIAALATAIVCLTASCAFAMQDYTVAEKLLKQLWAGSGFSGTLSVAFDTPTFSTRKPIVLDLDYIYVRPDEENTGEHRVDLILMEDENARSAACAQLKDDVLSFQADVISPDWYSFQDVSAKEPSAAQQQLDEKAQVLYDRTGVPALAETVMTGALSLVGAEGLAEIAETYQTRLDVWIEAYREDAILGKLPDGTTTMEVNYTVSPAAIKAQMKQMVVDLLSDDELIALLSERLDEDSARLMLNPELRGWYFEVIDRLSLSGDLTLSRTVSLKGDTLNLHLSLPLYDARVGHVTFTYDRTQGEGDLPDNNTITLQTPMQQYMLSYQQYSSMTGVEVTQGMVMCEQAESFAVGEDGPQPQDWAVAFTLKQQETETVDAQTRQVYGYDLSLTLKPDETLDNSFDMTETEIALTSRFASKELKSAATEMEATLSITDETSSLNLAFEGTSRKMWEPEELPMERVNVHELTQEDLTAILPGAALRFAALFADTLQASTPESH